MCEAKPAGVGAHIRGNPVARTQLKTLGWCASFRRDDQTTPLVLMVYYNPILTAYGPEAPLCVMRSRPVSMVV